MRIILLSLFLSIQIIPALKAQSWNNKKHLTRQDTLRGSITPERKWWDVLYYDLSIEPSYTDKTLKGQNTITYQVIDQVSQTLMQIDLHHPLMIDSAIFNDQEKVSFTRTGNVWYLRLPSQRSSSINTITIYYSGSPHVAKMAPWDGGWVWKRDNKGRPWMTVACQGIGASIWYPCKDHQSDEPDNGAALTMTVPDPLVAVANGRLQFKKTKSQ